MSTAPSTPGDDAARIDGLWDFNDPAATETVFRELLSRDAGANAGFRAQVELQIARTLSLQRRFDEAHAILDRLEPELQDLPPLVGIRHALERGRTLNSSGRRDESRAVFERAWRGAADLGADFYTVDAAHMLGIVAAPDDAMEWNERALAVAEASGDPRARRWVGSLCNNMGWTLHAAGDHTGAMERFVRALAARREHGTPRDIRVARWCVARCRRSLGEHDAALQEQRELARECAETNDPDGFVHEELAECLLALGRTDEARPHFAAAHALLAGDPWLAESEPDRIERLATLGGVNMTP